MKTNRQIMSTLEMKLGRKKYLDYEDFKDFVGSLSHSQGFYSRLYRDLLEMENNDVESLEKLRKTIDEQHFTDTLDFIYWLEC